MKKVTLELLIDENGDEDINPIKIEIEDALRRCYHDMKLVSYEESDIDARWFCTKKSDASRSRRWNVLRRCHCKIQRRYRKCRMYHI